MTTVVLNLKDDEMIKDELNKLVMSASSVKIQAPKKRRRSKNGEPKPYWDGTRAKHIGYFIDAKGKKHKVIGTGATLEQATKSRDRKLEQLKRSLSMSEIPTELITVESYCLQGHTKCRQLQHPPKLKRQPPLQHLQKPKICRPSVQALSVQKIKSGQLAEPQTERSIPARLPRPIRALGGEHRRNLMD